MIQLIKTSRVMPIALGLSIASVNTFASVLEEIVVQARKRSESIQEVPVAVSAFNADQVERRDIQSVIDLSAAVPNFQSPRNSVTFGAPQLYMRGAGRAETNWNAENAVALFIDDVYMQSTAGTYIDMIDVASIEVLRGPQGTLYGRNATTGAIKFNLRKPELESSRFQVDAAIGSNNRTDARVIYSAPIVVDELAYKLDMYYSANDGYLTLVDEGTNETLDDEFGHKEATGGRMGILWLPNEEWQFDLNFDASNQDNGTNLMTAIAPADPSDFSQTLSKSGKVKFRPVLGADRVAAQPILSQSGGGYELDSFSSVFKATWDTNLGTFRSITGWREYDENYSAQLSGLSSPSTAFGVTIYSDVETANEFEQFTQEFQFSGTLGDSFDYVGGIYYFLNDWAQTQYNGVLIPAEFSGVVAPGQTQSYGGAYMDTDQNSESYAIYVDATWQVNDSFAVFFGGRQTEDEKTVDYLTFLEDRVTVIPGFPVKSSESWSQFSPRIGLELQVNDEVLLYASYSEGFKAGVLEGARATDPVLASTWLDPEIVKTTEVGIKALWFQGQLLTNLAVFASDYSDKGDLIDAQTAAVADADIDGIELEVNWAATANLNLWLNLGLLDAKYTGADADHPIFTPGADGTLLGLDTDPVMTPDYSYTLGGDYTIDLGDKGSVVWVFTYREVDDHYNGLGVHNYDSEIVEKYNVLDASVTYVTADEKWSVALGGANLGDEEYYTTGFFGAIPEIAGRTYADGASWYLKLRYTL